MKKRYIYLHKGQDSPVSITLLGLCFLGGWLLATTLFYFLGHGVKASFLSFLN
jgi:hypothetical protein